MASTKLNMYTQPFARLQKFFYFFLHVFYCVCVCMYGTCVHQSQLAGDSLWI